MTAPRPIVPNPNRPAPTQPRPGTPSPMDPGQRPPKRYVDMFRIPGAPTPLNALIDCGRAWGKALVGVARLLTGRPM